MGLVFAVILFALGAVAVIVFGATPHGGPTTSCGPITVFGHTFTVPADCRYLSIGELAAAGLLIFLGIATAVMARPERTP